MDNIRHWKRFSTIQESGFTGCVRARARERVRVSGRGWGEGGRGGEGC